VCFLVDPFASPEGRTGIVSGIVSILVFKFSSSFALIALSFLEYPRGIISDCRIVWDVAILLSRQLENDARSTLHSFIPHLQVHLPSFRLCLRYVCQTIQKCIVESNVIDDKVIHVGRR